MITRIARLMLIVVAAVALAGSMCNPRVYLSPSEVELAPGGQQVFTATVVGTADKSVRWSADGGTLETTATTAIYTAPMETGTYRVRATSQAAPERYAEADVIVADPSPSPPSGAGVTILTPDLALTGPAERHQLEAVVHDATGQVVSDAVIAWSTSDASVATVDAEGRVTAGVSIGTTRITATHGAHSDSIRVFTARLAPGVVRVEPDGVLELVPADASVVLARSGPAVDLRVGDVLTDNQRFLGRAVAIGGQGDELVIRLEPVPFPEAFSQLRIDVLSDPIDLDVSFTGAGVVVTRVSPGLVPLSTLLPLSAFTCTPDWNVTDPQDMVSVTPPSMGFQTRLQVYFGAEVMDAYPDDFVIAVEARPSIDVDGGELRFAVSAQGTVVCALRLPTVTTDGLLPIGWGFSIDASLTPTLGFDATAGADGSVTISGPKVLDAGVTFTVGARHHADSGWQAITDAKFSIARVVEPAISDKVQAEAALTPFAALAGGVLLTHALDFWSRDGLVGVDIVEPRIYLEGAAGLRSPLGREHRDYEGPTWSVIYGADTKIKIELTGSLADLLALFDIPTGRDFGTVNLYGPKTWIRSPAPTIAIAVAPASADIAGPAEFTSTVDERYEGSTVEFWSFRGSGPGTKLASAGVDATGRARAVWEPAAGDGGEHVIRAYLVHGPFGALGLPYASEHTASMSVPAMAITSFSVEPAAAVAGRPVRYAWEVARFTGDAITCTLDPDVGDPSVPAVTVDCAGSLAHAYATSGDKTARLTVRHGSDEIRQELPVRVLVADIVRLGASDPVVVHRPTLVDWSIDADVRVDCHLDFDDPGTEQTVDCAAGSFPYVFSSSGPRTVRLRVSDGNPSGDVTAELELEVLGCGHLVVTTDTTMAAGRAHSLSVGRDGVVFAWGDNSSGQLGSPACTPGDDPPVALRPCAMGLDGVVAVAAGEGHSLALAQDGRVWSWGANSFGQLGNARPDGQFVPSMVLTCPRGVDDGCFELDGVVAIAAGASHSLAATRSGAVYAWGLNDKGQLGVDPATTTGACGSTPCSLWAVEVPLYGSEDFVIASVSAGSAHSLALDEAGHAWSWGDNAVGALGRPVPAWSSRPEKVVSEGEPLTGLRMVRAGGFHSLAMQMPYVGEHADGSVWAWGSNAHGQLGVRGPGIVTEPVRLDAPDLYCVAGIAVGDDSSYALRVDDGDVGTLLAWGRNDRRQLGIPNVDAVAVPTPGPDAPVWDAGWRCVSGGALHTLACTFAPSHPHQPLEAWSWGGNDVGQLGSGNRVDSLYPMEIGVWGGVLDPTP